MSASTKHSQPELEQALERARAARPSELAATDLRRLARRSVAEAAERRARGQLHRRAFALIGALACAAIGFMWQRDDRAVEPTRPAQLPWSPLELALPTGDKLSASPGAQFELVRSTDIARRIALRDGVVVFSIAPLASGETFGVQTPHAYVEVRGTVFSVEVGEGRTRVRVHEGAVQIQGAGTPRTLRSGERFGTDGTPVPELPSVPLARRAAELVAERERDLARALAARAEPEARDAAVGPGAEPPVPGADRAPRVEHAERLAREADALRSLGRAREAVDLYLQAHAALPPPAGASAAFKAADLCLRVLSDPSRTLRVLDQTALDAPGSLLRERALLLRIDAAQRLGRPVRELAERYLDEYPDSAGSERMRSLSR
jgi:ferric-dicitrate binding protein FerR (iron transport regulator)